MNTNDVPNPHHLQAPETARERITNEQMAISVHHHQ